VIVTPLFFSLQRWGMPSALALLVLILLLVVVSLVTQNKRVADA